MNFQLPMVQSGRVGKNFHEQVCMMLTEHIIPSTNQLEIEYESALKTYLARGGEDALQQAYEFGRSAVFAGLGILDVAEIHHRAISAILPNRPPEVMAQRVKH